MTLILTDDEAFTPEEIGTRYVRHCTRCPRPYGVGDYSEHADRYHNEGRTGYWREYDRRARLAPQERRDKEGTE